MRRRAQHCIHACSGRIRSLVATLRQWLHRLWLIDFRDAVPDPFLHVPRYVSALPPLQLATVELSCHQYPCDAPCLKSRPFPVLLVAG